MVTVLVDVAVTVTVVGWTPAQRHAETYWFQPGQTDLGNGGMETGDDFRPRGSGARLIMDLEGVGTVGLCVIVVVTVTVEVAPRMLVTVVYVRVWVEAVVVDKTVSTRV